MSPVESSIADAQGSEPPAPESSTAAHANASLAPAGEPSSRRTLTIASRVLALASLPSSIAGSFWSSRKLKASHHANPTATATPASPDVSAISPPPTVDLLLSYVSTDERWVHWLHYQLQHAGYQCRLLRWDPAVATNLQALQRHQRHARHLLVIYTDSYHNTALKHSDWVSSHAGSEAKAASPVILLRVGERAAEGPLATIPRITLHGQPLLAARKRLLDGLATRCPLPCDAPSRTLASLEAPPLYPGDMPAVWAVPIPPDPRFVGRDTKLNELSSTLRDWRRVVIGGIADLEGVGGIGKTQLAIHYAWHYRDRYDTVLWASATTTRVLLSNLSALCARRALALPEANAPSQGVQVKAVLAAIQQRPRTLLILDSVEHGDVALEVERLLTSTGRCHVIMTSRQEICPPSFKRIELAPLSTEAASAYLVQHGQIDPGIAPDMAGSVHCIPIGLEIAAACHRHNGQYLEEIRRLPPARVDDSTSALAQAIDVAYARLSVPAAAVLRLVSLLAGPPLPIAMFALPPALLHEAMTLINGRVPAPEDALPEPEAILAELANLALLTATPWQVTCPRFVQEQLRNQWSADQPQVWLSLALRWLTSHLPTSSTDAGTWSTWEQLRPHLEQLLKAKLTACNAELAATLTARLAAYLGTRHLTPLADQSYLRAIGLIEQHFGLEDPRLAPILSQVGDFLARTERGPHAEKHLRRALAIVEKAFGPDHPNTAQTMADLAMVLMGNARYNEAEPLLRCVLRITEAQVGSRHPRVATAMANLGELLHITDNPKEAQHLFQTALEIDETMLGPEHLSVARDLYGLAEVLRANAHRPESEPLYFRAFAIEEKHLGPEHPSIIPKLTRVAHIMADHQRYSEAEPLYRRLLLLLERHRGSDHPDTSSALNSLGVVLAALNKTAEAEAAYRRAVTLIEAALGASHTSIAAPLNNLGALCETTQRIGEAEQIYRRVLAIFEATPSPNDAALASACGNLANVLTAERKTDEAAELYRRAIAIDQRIYGLEHPKIALRLNNLASLLLDAGRVAEAEKHYRHALDIDTRYLGANDPAVGRDMNNLGELLIAAGKLEEAEWFCRRSLEIEEAAVGPNHPNLASRLTNLADILRTHGRNRQAEQMYRRVLSIYTTAYGPDHGNVAAAMNNLANLLKSGKRFKDAEPLYRRALEIDQKTLGPDHPRLAVRLNNLAGLFAATSRHAEAEPLFRRAISILRDHNKATGIHHPEVDAVERKYFAMLVNAGLSEAEAARRVGPSDRPQDTPKRP